MWLGINMAALQWGLSKALSGYDGHIGELVAIPWAWQKHL